LLAAIQNENPHIARRLRGASQMWERPLAVSSIPYGHLAGQPDGEYAGLGLWQVGDQAACIPSFTGDGMSIALHSGALAAQMAIAGASVDRYHQVLQAHLSRSMGLATFFSRTIVSGAGRMLAPVALSLFPHAMNWIAASTRIPDRALDHTRSLAQPAQRSVFP
jgi:flavin-dependent dehydrogenase